MEAIGWATYIFYAAWNLVALFVVWKWFVETKGKTLEEIHAVFNDGAGGSENIINKSFELHESKQMKEQRSASFDSTNEESSKENNFITQEKEDA